MKYVIALGFIAVIVGVFAYTALFDSPKLTGNDSAQDVAEMSGGDQATNGQGADDIESGRSSLEALRLMGRNMECSINYQDETNGQEIAGTFFIADGRTRGDFLTESPDLSGQVLSSIILDGDMFYTWSEIDGKLYGMKMDMTVVGDMGGQETHQAVPMDKDIEYECAPWENIDNTIFEPPSGVLFQDFSAMLKSGMEYGTIYEEGAEMPY